MSNYLTALKTTTRFKTHNAEAILNTIKEKAKKYEDCYAWKRDVLNATKLKDVTDDWNIELYYTDFPAGSCIPIVRNTYESSFLRDMAEAAAPFMEDGYIEGLDQYGRFKVRFNNGKVSFSKENLFTPLSKEEDDLPFA